MSALISLSIVIAVTTVIHDLLVNTHGVITACKLAMKLAAN